ncbi:MAG: RdgB/HAM1 family non-canonical purine NTP pyrophosphatase [Acidobacteriota bacterium]
MRVAGGVPCLLLASGNRAKRDELHRLTRNLPWRIVAPAEIGPSSPRVAETGATFKENAVLKALAVERAARVLGHDLWVLADDSGLMVDALGGAPGVRSARFAGEEIPADQRDRANVALLLSRLRQVPEAQRTARFLCVLAVAHRGSLLFTEEGRVEGRILSRPRGTGGFGYDPVFYHPSSRATFAELHPEEKARVSHRGQALARLARRLERAPPAPPGLPRS